MQKWEYKTIVRARGFDDDPSMPKARWYKGTDWNMNIVTELLDLGERGWELVAVVPRSSYLGGVGNINYPPDLAGFTNEELWVFKRPMLEE